MASKTRRFFVNGLSLTLTALMMRGIGMLFSVYVSNIAGSEAMGLYSLLGSVYALSITVATASINLGTTRLVSDALGLSDNALAQNTVKKALLVCTITGSVASILLFSLSGTLSERLLCDARAERPLKILAMTLVPIALSSCLSGYFNAVRRVRTSAVFQVLAQFLKIGVTISLLSVFVKSGVEKACIALVLGGAVSEIFSLILTYILYLCDRRKLTDCKIVEKSPSNGEITKKLLGITLPVTFSACIRSALTMFQHALIPKGLRANGKSWSQALSSYGALHGMAMPLILFPSAFIGAFSGLLIPEISECCVRKEKDRLRRVSYRTLSLSLFFSIGVSGIMLFFSNELGMLIYHSEETAKYIRIMSPLIPIMYIDSAVDAILKGSGHHIYSMNINIADALTACIFAMTLVPKLGIWGYIISIYATEILNTALSLCKMISISDIRPKIFHQVIMPIVCIIGATNATKLVLSLMRLPIGGAVILTLQILLTAIVYVLLLLVTKTVGIEEKEFLSAALKSSRIHAE